MHSRAMPGSSPRPAVRAGWLSGRAKSVAAASRPDRPWTGLEADPLTPGRAPGESYRDYLFRQSIRG